MLHPILKPELYKQLQNNARNHCIPILEIILISMHPDSVSMERAEKSGSLRKRKTMYLDGWENLWQVALAISQPNVSCYPPHDGFV